MTGARRRDFDVVIIGGGMVGLCAAALLARDERLAGWRIAVVESAAPRPPDPASLDLRVSALSGMATSHQWPPASVVFIGSVSITMNVVRVLLLAFFKARSRSARDDTFSEMAPRLLPWAAKSMSGETSCAVL